MDTPLQLLIVEDSESDALLLLRELRKSGYDPAFERVDTAQAMEAALAAQEWDIVLSDFVMPGFNGLAALRLLKESGHDIPFIIVSGIIGEETAVEVMKAGAHDYIIKGNLARLAPAIERELTEAVVRRKSRQVEEALRESERRYRNLIESVTDYIYTVQMNDGRPVATHHGPGCEAVTGYTPQEYNADPDLWLRMVDEEDRPSVMEQAASLLAGKTLSPLEHRIIHKDGRVCWIENTPVPHYNQEGLLTAYDGIVKDITKRKQSEMLLTIQQEELRESEEKMHIIAESAADAIISIDCDGAISYWNPAAERILGYASHEVMGRELHPMLAPEHYLDDYRKGFAIFRKIGTGKAIGKAMEFMALKKDGSEISVEVSFSAMNPKGRWGAIGILRDIGERKNLEKQLHHARKMEAIGVLTSGISHDFNNILTAIIGFSTFIEMGMNKDDPQRENLNNVLAAAGKGAELTRRLLTFSRKETNHPQPIDISQTINAVERFLQRVVGEDIEFKTSYSQETMIVNADVGQIEQVLMNLAANARDAMPQGGILSIETAPVVICNDFIKVHGYGNPGEYALISVTDSGMGMDEATRAKIFVPFFTTKEVGKGTGLGMAIVYGIVKQHNGFINVYSEQGVGTTFTIYLPRIRSVARDKADCKAEILERGTETILVADDDQFLRELSQKVLSQFGYTVITADNGQDAIDRFNENRDKIDLVIMDIVMPGKSGKEAFAEMQKIRPGIKSIFISGYTADILHKRGILEKDPKFLSKPMRPLEMLKKVREVLDQ